MDDDRDTVARCSFYRETYSAGFPKPCQRVSKAHSKELAKSSAEFLSPGTTLYLASLALMDLLTSRRLVSDGFRGLPDSLGSPGLPNVYISRSLFFAFFGLEKSHIDGTPAAVSAPS